MAGLPSRSLWKKTRWLSGEKMGATENGSLQRCSQSVSSRRVRRSRIRMCGELRLRLAPTNTEASPLEPKCANWLVVEIALSRFSSGVCSRIEISLDLSAGSVKEKKGRAVGGPKNGA